jgi:hypothetical protein
MENQTKFEFFSETGEKGIIFTIGNYFQDYDFSKVNFDEVKKNADKRKVLIDDWNEYLRKEPVLSTMTKEIVGEKVILWQRLTHWDAIIHNKLYIQKEKIYCQCRFSAVINNDWCGPFSGYGIITW